MSNVNTNRQLTSNAITIATNAVEQYIKSVHLVMVPWCQCCQARVDIDHVCSCEQSSEEGE